MSVNTARVQGRRTLHFADFNQLLADAELVATRPSRTIGNWSVGQILDHLAVAANCPFDGFGDFKASWFTRRIIVPFIKNSLLTKALPAGVKLPADATSLMPQPDVSPEVGLERLRQALGRFSRETPSHDHPVFGALAMQEWVALALRHAELHLSFVIPESPATAAQ